MATVTGKATVGSGGSATVFSLSAPITLPSAPPVLVGNTIPNLALTAGMYDAGMTQAAADTKFCNIVGRGLAGGQHLAVTKKFWNKSDWSTTKNDLRNYAKFGTTVIFAIWPAFPATTAEQTNLTNFLTTIKGFGFNSKNCYIVPWQEPEVNQKVTAAEYQVGLEAYGPIINAAGLPLVCDIGTGGGETDLHAYGNSAIAAMNNGVKLAGLAQDYYAPQSITVGLTLDTLSGLADANGIGFGVFEHGVVPSKFTVAQCTKYLNYIYDFMIARRNAGKLCLPVVYYDGQGSPTGSGDLTSPIGQDPSTAVPDFRIALWQRAYDQLCGLS